MITARYPFVASTYKSHLVEHVWETCYEPDSVMLGEVPNMNYSSYSS